MRQWTAMRGEGQLFDDKLLSCLWTWTRVGWCECESVSIITPATTFRAVLAAAFRKQPSQSFYFASTLGGILQYL